jgi:hypothetical protein
MEAASLAPALPGGPPFNIKERGHNNARALSPLAQNPSQAAFPRSHAMRRHAGSENSTRFHGEPALNTSLQKFDS